MKYIKWYTWVGIGLVFFLLMITIGKTTIFIKDVAHTEAMSVEVNSEQIETGIRMETETKEADSFTSVKKIPYIQMEEIDQPIHEWATKQEQDFYEEMKTNETFLQKDIDAHFSMESEVHKLSDEIYNITIESVQSVDGENEYKTTKSFTFDRDKEAIINLKDIIKNDMLNKKALSAIFLKHTEAEIDKKSLKEKLNELNEIAWSVDDEEFVFYFNRGDISDENETIHIPLKEIYNYLDKDYYAILISDELDAEIKEQEAQKKQEAQEKLSAKKQIAITFDDGPHPTETKRILDTLDKYDAKATFFMLSSNVKAYPGIAQEVADRGHEIANHSISHSNLKAISKKQAKKEVIDSAKVIKEITGENPKNFRPPYGNYNDNIVDFALESNQSLILWSVDTRDWDVKSSNAVYQQVANHVEPGSIILMHDIHKTTADALPKVLKYLKAEGYELVTVSELMPLLEEEGIGPYYGK